jgi:hypothetical protein
MTTTTTYDINQEFSYPNPCGPEYEPIIVKARMIDMFEDLIGNDTALRALETISFAFEAGWQANKWRDLFKTPEQAHIFTCHLHFLFAGAKFNNASKKGFELAGFSFPEDDREDIQQLVIFLTALQDEDNRSDPLNGSEDEQAFFFSGPNEQNKGVYHKRKAAIADRQSKRMKA